MSDFTFLSDSQFHADLSDVVEQTDYPHMTIGEVTTLPAGSDATATFTGTDDAPVLNLGIPQGLQGIQGIQGIQGEQGETGLTPSFSIGTVSTLPAGSSATVTITGTDENPVLNLGIPQGIQGETGATGADGKDGKDGKDGADGRPGADPFAFIVTLASANWSAGVQTVSDANFLTGDYCYMVYASPSSTYAWQDADVYADDVTTDGQMVFHCDVTPSSDIVANVIRLVIDS